MGKILNQTGKLWRHPGKKSPKAVVLRSHFTPGYFVVLADETLLIRHYIVSLQIIMYHVRP